MATKIPNMNNFVYHPKFGFISKRRILIWVLIVCNIIALFSFILFVEAKQQELISVINNNPVIKELTLSTQEKVARYIIKINPSLEYNTAIELANAIVEESELRNIPIKLILGIGTIESRFEQYAISNAGALGFFQVIPRWHYDKIRALSNQNIYDPITNTKIGMQILEDCIEKSSSIENALLCYNGSQTDKTQKYAVKVLTTAQEINI